MSEKKKTAGSHLLIRCDVLVAVITVLGALESAVIAVFYLPLNWGTQHFPVSAGIAGAINLLLVYLAAQYGKGYGRVGLSLWVWLLVVATFMFIGGPGADVLLPNDWRSLFVLAVGFIPGFSFVVGRSFVGAPSRLVK
ncbi:MAG: hypothetical protein ACRCSF_11280 [Mycobacteriaceae bacterium]